VLGEEDLQELFAFEDRALAGLLQPVGEGLPTLGRDAVHRAGPLADPLAEGFGQALVD
jgi:hypothetical protein